MKRLLFFFTTIIVLMIGGCSQQSQQPTVNQKTSTPSSNSQTQAPPTGQINSNQQNQTSQSSASPTSNGLKLQSQNEHFIFYANDIDAKAIPDLAKSLESNYAVIVDHLKATMAGKVKIEIYPDLKAFHAAIGQSDAPDWVVGSASGFGIKIVSPLNSGGTHTYESMLLVITHEFTHVVQRTLNPNIFGTSLHWLWEGIACYEANQINGVSSTVKSKIKSNSIPSLKQLEGSSTEYGKLGGYQFGYTIAEYIVKTYGYNKLRELIIQPNEFQSILGVSKDEFEKKWKEYLISNYQ